MSTSVPEAAVGPRPGQAPQDGFPYRETVHSVDGWTKEQILSLGDPDPEMESILAQTDPSVLDVGQHDYRIVRDLANKAKLASPPTPPPRGVSEREVKVEVRDGSWIPARIYQPEAITQSGPPVYVNFHGGGFVLGDLDSDAYLCRMLVLEVGAVVVDVGYRLAPEWPFPTAVWDCFDALLWIAEKAGDIGADPKKGFVVAGTSAGGNLAAVCSHLARDENMQPPLTGVHLMIPSICGREVVPEKYKERFLSVDQMADNSVLSIKAMRNFRQHYDVEFGSPLYNVINWPTGHQGLPKHWVQVCGADMLRDEALIYEQMIREEGGVETRLNVYAGLPHGFWAVWPDMAGAKRFRDGIVDGAKWLLGH